MDNLKEQDNTTSESIDNKDTEKAPEVYFEDLDLSDNVLDALYDMRFEKCTPVQAQCIPPILEHHDVLGVAQTGTGKTAAYLLPLLTLLERDPHPADAVNCLVIAPTRELARQIDQALQGFAYYTGVNAVAVYGGNDGIRYEQERRSLQAGADIVLATPGRLITHLQLGTLDLSRTTHLVLDEADRMLDMGFAEDILSIVKQMPEHRQTILFSATMPPKIAELARTVMHNPVEVEIAVSKPAENIKQSLYICHESDKAIIQKKIFKEHPPQPVNLFCSSKQKVKELAIVLKRSGLNACAMHSDLAQAERDEVMNLFRAHKVDLLVATDIVARGIDIDDITMVINYDAPHDAEDYVHRIGRTARAGREGSAITLIGEKDLYALSNIERTLKIKIPRAELPEGVRPPQTEPQHGRGGRNGGNGNGRGRNGGSREQRNSHDKRGGEEAQGKGRNNHRRNDKRQAQGGKPHGKSDNRPAAQKRPPKNGTGRKPE
ncbi:DEAD/DEAH box helicase [Prevotellamassilia timonensis]|uniref:DEAD/DEAH box helicase n=1 Tax=Prevotellamassilia timonensis TaxID=1852370 RepID=UPI004025265E